MAMRTIHGALFANAGDALVGHPVATNIDGQGIQVTVKGDLLHRYMVELALSAARNGQIEQVQAASNVARVILLSNDEVLLVFPGWRMVGLW